jgi:hypothetical protein
MYLNKKKYFFIAILRQFLFECANSYPLKLNNKNVD